MDFALETTFDLKFTTRQFSTGAPFTLAGTPAVEIYEDNSTTQITAAETLTVDFDAITGLNNLRVAATAANGFELGKSYTAVISAGTVDSVSVVGEVIANFSIGRSAAATDLANGTDGLGALKALIDTVDTVVDGIQTDLSNGTDGLGALKALIDTLTTNVGTVDTVVDAIKLVTDNLPDSGALSSLATAAALATVDTNVDTLVARLTATRAGYLDNLTNLDAAISSLNNLSAAQVNAEVDTALADYDPPTKAELDSAVSPLATAAALVTVDTVVDAIKAVTDLLPDAGALTTLITHLTDIKGGTFSGVTDSLEAIRDRGDAAWTGGGAAPTVEQIRAEIDSNSTQLAAILTDTGTDIPALIAALENLSSAGAQSAAAAALTAYDPPTRAEATADKNTITALIGAPAEGTLALDIEEVRLDTEAIRVTKLGGITSLANWLGALAGKQTANATALTEIKARGVGGGTYDPATDSLEALRDNQASAAPSAASIADAVWDELQSAHTSAGSFGEIASEIASILVDTGTTLDGKLDTVDAVVDAIKLVTDALPDSGALTTLLSNVAAILTDTGTTLPAQIDALNDPTAAAIADAVWDEAQADHTTADTFGKYLDSEVSGAGGGGAPTAAAIADAVWDEALADHLSVGSTGEGLNAVNALTGSGAYSITVTITDGTDPLENATVRASEGGNAFVGTTDAGGNITFALDAATYSVAVTKSGYSFTPTTRTVTGEEAGTLTDDIEMTAISAAVPSTPDMSVITGTVLFPNGDPANHVEILFELVAVDGAESGGNIIVQSPALEVETDVNGELPDPTELVRTDGITVVSGTPQYRITCEQLGVRGKLVAIDSATHDIATLLST